MKRREAVQRMALGAIGGTLARSSILANTVPLFGRAQQKASAAFQADVELSLVATAGEVQILPGQTTRVWRFTGSVSKGPSDSLVPIANSYLGPTIRVRKGQNVRIRFSNRLPGEDTIVHWHGMDVPAAMDGHPHLSIPSGQEYVYEFMVVNRAGTYWYHPHPHMRTGPHVYRGLAGLFIVSDDEESALGLPSGSLELTCVLQDRLFDSSNQLVYMAPEAGMMDQMHGFLGNETLINGQRAPELSLATRAYRVRMLNGSSARIYKLEWSDGTPMTVIGTHGGLLERPVQQRYLTLAPAQRADVILDMSSHRVGSSLELRSAQYPLEDVDRAGMAMGGMSGMGGMGGMRGMGMRGGMQTSTSNGTALTLMHIRIARQESSPFSLPERLSASAGPASSGALLPMRRVEIGFENGQWRLGGRTFDMMSTAPDEEVPAGSSQIWELVNVSGMMGSPMAHPIHLHGRQFRVLSRQQTFGAAAQSIREGLVDAGLLDTVLVLPGETVRIEVHYSEYPGLYLYHCHILEHEDMGMMRNFRVRAR